MSIVIVGGNDTITSISAWTDGIDACSGAAYSSNGIIETARKALEQAMNRHEE
ncbi:MAG: FMN-binding protein [Ruminococcus sp.]|nr:FMN-binding protein [Ruminococcus sp.]